MIKEFIFRDSKIELPEESMDGYQLLLSAATQHWEGEPPIPPFDLEVLTVSSSWDSHGSSHIETLKVGLRPQVGGEGG